MKLIASVTIPGFVSHSFLPFELFFSPSAFLGRLRLRYQPNVFVGKVFTLRIKLKVDLTGLNFPANKNPRILLLFFEMPRSKKSLWMSSVTVCRFVIFLYIAVSPKETILTAHSNEQILECVRPIFEFFEREVKIGLARKENTKISLLGMSLT